MRTPAGVECKYFYGDYRRGRKNEECRLVELSPTGVKWTSDLCRTCPVPGILRANACENLVLKASVEGTWLGLRRKVAVRSYCLLSKQDVAEPHVGCGMCHPLPTVFATREQNDPYPSA